MKYTSKTLRVTVNFVKLYNNHLKLFLYFLYFLYLFENVKIHFLFLYIVIKFHYILLIYFNFV
jgi:hypothetical protein